MSFTSPEFVLFFALVIPLHFALGHRWRWLWLLVMSYVFYAYGQLSHLPLLWLATGVVYVAARRIAVSERQVVRARWLWLSVGVNLGVLFAFKYLNFFNASLSGVALSFGLDYAPGEVNLILPVGISFYTFQAIAYVVDVYRGRLAPEKHVGYLGTYIALFPQLVAGPIERAGNLLPQLRARRLFDVDRTVEGLQRILWGFFKKIVIADRLAIYVNEVYNNPQAHDGLTLTVATLFFAFQIYCDFSAYSDIAIGTARILGIRLMENFRQPYLASSVLDFWRRWHISLSTWIRDYLFMPLSRALLRRARGRSTRLVEASTYLIVMGLVGLWHGAGWTFIIWGLLFGAYMAFETSFKRPLRRMSSYALGRALRWVLTFALINLAWVFFRANSLDDAGYILAHLTVWDSGVDLSAPFAAGLLGAQVEFALSWALIALLIGVDLLQERVTLAQAFSRTPGLVRWGLYYALGGAVIFAGLYGTGAQQFIYFQF